MSLCCAPDTFLGAGIQTCKKWIEDGHIGSPIGAAAFMICHGHEAWHPDPAFYYKRGGGPMLDMGPYYLTALVELVGRVSGVFGLGRRTFEKRVVGSGPKAGTQIDVEVPTYVTGLLQFQNGAVGSIFTTFDVYYDRTARLEVYGTEGTLFVPDPNGFGGPVFCLRAGSGEKQEVPLSFGYDQNSRGLGLADMAEALRDGRAPRANGTLALHVLEIMEGIAQSSDCKTFIPIA